MSHTEVNIAEFAHLKHQMEQLAGARKATKSKMDDIQKKAVDLMLQMRVRFIAEKEGGPFWTLTKDVKEGTWKVERYNEFFIGILSEMAKGKRYTPEMLTTTAQQYLKQFEKRGLKIEKHTTARRKDVDDLVVWLDQGATE